MSSIIVPGLKVSQLPLASQITSQDAFYLVDIETDTSKKTTFATISAAVAQNINLGNLNYVQKSGDTMTGGLILNGDPTVSLQAATKQYVDQLVLSGSGVPAGVFVPVSGGAMTGFLTLNANPTANLHAAPRQYVHNFVPLSGGAMTNFLTLNADPVNNLHAATKQYVDSLVPNASGGGTKFGRFIHQITDSVRTEMGRWITYFVDNANQLRVSGLFASANGYNGGQGSVGDSNIIPCEYITSSIDFSPYTNQYAVSVVGLNYAQWVLTNGGYVFATGNNTNGILRFNTTTEPIWGQTHYPYWAQIPLSSFNNNPVSQLITSTGNVDGNDNNGSIFAITTAGELYGWGYNDVGQLGLSNVGNTNYQPDSRSGSSNGNNFRWPVQIAPTAAVGANGSLNGKNIKFVASAGKNDNGYTFVIATDNTVHSTGYNNYGQLGLGNTTTRYQFNSVGMTADSITVGGWGYCTYLLSGGQVWAAGWNTFGCLGDGTTTNRSSFVLVLSGVGAPIGGISRVISGGNYNGYNNVYFLTSNKQLFACGYNGYGQLGTGDQTNRSYATLVATGVDQIKTGSYGSNTFAAILTGNSIFTTGYLGDGTIGGIGNRTTYTQVGWRKTLQPQGTLWSKFDFSQHAFNNGAWRTTVMAVDTNNNLWTWGDNTYGTAGYDNYAYADAALSNPVPRRAYIQN
jgi:alpha-tubulin suppressor-like RCC1 family protein